MEASTKPREQQETGGQPVDKDVDKAKEQRIPYERFDEVNKRAKQAEEELADLRNKLVEFEDRDKSEVDRERSARQRAESQLNELMGKVTSLEKGAWVRSAAAELNFHDPEDAVAHLQGQLGKLEDHREANRLVERLAKSKDHLVRQETKKERPAIGRVYAGDETQQPNGQPAQQPNAQQLLAQQEQHFAEGLREQLSKFLPENSDNWYDAGSA
jgi:hypothetical protein